MPASRSRYEVLRTRLDAYTKFLDQAERGDARAIHRTRVASRRLRELVPVLQLDRDECRRLRRALRDVTRELGRLRELDVLASLVEDLQRQTPSARRALAVVRDELRTRRSAAHADAVADDLGRRLARVARRLERVADTLGTDHARETRRWLWAVDARVTRRATAVNEAVDQAGSLYLPERLHEVRKAVKKLRYAAELQFEARPGGGRGELARLRRVQELLGDLHDRQTVMEPIRAVQAAAGPARQGSAPLDAVLASLEDECRHLHGRYLKGRGVLLGVCERLGGGRANRDTAPGEHPRARRVARR